MKNKNKKTLGFLLARTSNAMSTYFNGFLKEQGIDIPHSQYIVLKILNDEDGISQHELSVRTFKDEAAVKRTLDILEKKGLVKRVPTNTRKNNIVLTEEGRALMPRICDCVKKSKQTALSGITDAEYNIFVNILERIYENMK